MKGEGWGMLGVKGEWWGLMGRWGELGFSHRCIEGEVGGASLGSSAMSSISTLSILVNTHCIIIS